MSLTPPPFDPELGPALEVLRRTIAPSLSAQTILEQRRALAAQSPSLADLARGGEFELWERTAPGPPGAPEVELLFARPARGPRARSTAVLYFTHAGGMVMGDRRLGVDTLYAWALEFDLLIVSVEYRLAPEHPYPAGIDDAYAGLQWVRAHAGQFGASAERVMLVGASSGGGMAAALALRLRDRGAPPPIGQLLMYPMLDDRNDTPSTWQMAGLGMWDRIANETAWAALLGDERGASPGVAVPSRATDLSGLAPTFLDVGTAETFRDEVVDYATRIAQAGGEVELHLWPGGFHAFDFWVPGARISRDAIAARTQWLRRQLTGHDG